MAGFEVIVRPVLFPNIRPVPTRSLPPADDPTQGQAVLSGGSGQVIALTHSYNGSASTAEGTEIERTFDVARIKSKDGSSDVYIDVEVVNELKMKSRRGDTSTWQYTPIAEQDNIQILRRNETRKS